MEAFSERDISSGESKMLYFSNSVFFKLQVTNTLEDPEINLVATAHICYRMKEEKRMGVE